MKSLQSGQATVRRHTGAVTTTTAVALVAVLTMFLLSACGDSRTPAASESVTPPPAQSATSATLPELTRETAVVIAEDAFAQDHSAATAVENPHDIVTRLMRFRELRGAETLPEYATHGDNLVWIAQVEGTSHASNGEPAAYHFNAVAIDAVTGDVISRLQSENEPFILPLGLLPGELIDTGIDEREIQRDSLPVTRDEAVEIITSNYINGRHQEEKIEGIETALVRYSGPFRSGESSTGPTPTPTAASHQPITTSAAGSPSTPAATATTHVSATSTPVVERLSWLVIVPGQLSFSGCLISGPSREFRRPCWMSVEYYFVDAETGDVHNSNGQVFLGPLLNSDERAALKRFAWAEGWWRLWHEVSEYNNERIPEGLATELDRPDAPTPTPQPPTATPSKDPTPPLTPTPHPYSTTPTPTQPTGSTSTPAPVIVTTPTPTQPAGATPTSAPYTDPTLPPTPTPPAPYSTTPTPTQSAGSTSTPAPYIVTTPHLR